MTADKKPGETIRRALYALGGIVVLVLVIAIAGRADPPLTIAIHQSVEGVALKQVIARFAAQKKIPVEVIELPYEQLFAAEMKQVRSAVSAYDVIMADDPWMPALISHNAEGKDKNAEIMDLRRIDLSENICSRLDDFVPALLAVGRHPYSGDTDLKCTDKFYGLPFVGNSQLFAFRKVDSLGKPVPFPKNWQEATRSPGYVMRVGPGNPIVTDFMPMLWDISPDTFPTMPGADLSLPQDAARAFGYLSAMGSRPENLGIISYDDFDLAIQLANGQATMSIVWSAWAMAMAGLPEPQLKRLKENVSFGQIPGPKPELGGWLLAIPAKASNPNANAFIAFALRDDQLREAARVGNPPPVKSILRDKTLRDVYWSFDAQLASLMNARARPRTPHWAAVEQVFGRCLSVAYESALVPENNNVDIRATLTAEANRRLVDRSNAAIKAAVIGEPMESFSCMKD